MDWHPTGAVCACVRPYIILGGSVCITTTHRCLDLQTIYIQQCVQRKAESQQDNQQAQTKVGLAGLVGI